jgi:hypothetical protein
VFSADTLLKVADTKTSVALIAVKWTDYARVAGSQGLLLTPWGASRATRGEMTALNPEVQLLNGAQVVMATAVFTDSSAMFLPGMVVRCRFECSPVTGFERLRRYVAAQNVWPAAWGRG